MEERQDLSLSQRFEQYRPTKTVLFWACAASVAATIVIGFSVGGWVTGGTAQDIANRAAAQSRHELTASICVDRFMGSTEARAQLTALKGITSGFRQRQFVQDGGWAVMPGAERAESQAADLCAKELVKLEVPATQEASDLHDEATVAQ